MTERLPPQPWMEDPAARAVIAALEAEGGRGCARFVGGCVRNALIGAPVDDVDVATQVTPGRVVAALEQAGLKAAPTGIEHGTITAVADHRPFEVTTLRRDVETDGRRAVVAFTDDWAEDAARRDFRLNALYADADGTLHDPTGRGVADARAGRIVFVGDPDTRIREDYLRILRFFRFQAWYGRGEPDAEGLAACARLREGLARLSGERLGKELLKLLAARDPRNALAAMRATGVLQQILPATADAARLDALVPLSADPVLRLSALLPDEEGEVRAAAARLRLSNAQRDRLLAALPGDPMVSVDMSPQEARRAVYRLGGPAFEDRLLRDAAERGGNPGPLMAALRGWSPPRLPVDGAALQQAGVAPGPALGATLRRLEEAWLASDFQLDRTALLRRL